MPKDAMKHNKRSIITVETKKTDDHIILNISDQGHGIKKEDQDKIFDTYFTTKEVGKGTGMGLSIVSSLITEIDGKIEVNSEINKGTKFIITIPRSKTIPQTKVNKEIKEPTAKLEKLKGQIFNS